jgi:hypothetical protein
MLRGVEGAICPEGLRRFSVTLTTAITRSGSSGPP